ncbi:OPT oligopeptide transporter [Armillaria gallica]|uniref:OPT oligopeptide transporter n=1 Tax=Armillaria gallica TaxID=47427 RepID=A0A2H3E5L3_ARMGA|nr:OPT oligopeptide transporter [Armillaria gallica]
MARRSLPLRLRNATQISVPRIFLSTATLYLASIIGYLQLAICFVGRSSLMLSGGEEKELVSTVTVFVDAEDCIKAVDGSSLKFVESSSYDSTDADIDKNADYDFDDPNLEKSPIESIADEEESDSRRSHASVFEDDSPYPEVRSAVANSDDPSIPVSTVRSWMLGIIWAMIIPGLNQFFFFRYPSLTLTGIFAQLTVFPVGRALARFVPRVKVLGIPLNPGPFSIKEHVLITIMATVGACSAYATDIVAVQRLYYNQDFGFGHQWMMIMSTQLIGFSIGGIARRFLVQPPSMIWPTNLVTCALFNTLHAHTYAGVGHRAGIGREAFFLYAFIGSFCWYFVPGYLFTALSTFTWVTWMAPNSVPINEMFGYVHGMGMSVITFDWAQIAYISSPLATPWWAEANVFAGFVLAYWIIVPALHFTDVWYGKYMPISSRGAYDNTGASYNVTRIINPDTTFNEEQYQAYSPLFLSTTFAMSYGLSFASITATVTHSFLYFRAHIMRHSRLSLQEQPDIHARLMSYYPQVPSWWYAIVFITMFIFGSVSIELWDTKFPIHYFILALAISFVYVIPVGIIQAITNQQISLNVFTELIIGFAHPGRPVSMMLFKTYGYVTMTQALQFTSDFKLGHYMKIPPRIMFLAQVLAAVIAGTTQLGVQTWLFENIEDICTPNQKDGWTCPSTEVFGTASVIWGVIGPSRQLSRGKIYYALVFCFIIGVVCPVLAYYISRKFRRNGWLSYLTFPIIFSGTGYMPPASAVNYVPWAAVGFIFQFYIRRYHFSWWTKYNYVLSAALDGGVAFAAVAIYFCLNYPMGGKIGEHSIKSWWGNAVVSGTADYKGIPMRTVTEGDYFGPRTWS